MGATNSNLKDLSSNSYLKQFVGAVPIDLFDPFWNQLLSFSTDLPSETCSDSSAAPLLRQLCETNTGNLRTLVRIFLSRTSELKTSLETRDDIFVWQTHNALFIIRHVCRHLVNNLHGDSGLVKHFDATTLEEFLTCLVEMLVDVPLVSSTYLIQLEVVNTLLTLLSSPCHLVPSHLMCGPASTHANLLVKRLFMTFISLIPLPPGCGQTVRGGGSVALGLASSLWSVLGGGGGGKSSSTSHEEHPLSHRCLLLLLVLSHTPTPPPLPPPPGATPTVESNLAGVHNHTDSPPQEVRDEEVAHHLPNPYKEALATCMDSMERGFSDTTFRLDYSAMFDTLCDTIGRDEAATVALYFLLHENSSVANYVLARTDIERLVVPLLHTLYTSSSSQHHVYMSLIILLILSEDELFNKTVHDVVVPQPVDLYKERHLSSDLTLGGLLVLVVVRALKANLNTSRDRYLHTNCLATLANMSARFSHLDLYVSQRLVGLFEMLAKRHAKLANQLQDGEKEKPAAGGTAAAAAVDMAGSSATVQVETTVDRVYDLTVLEEVMRMVLEILNSTLTHNLHTNPHLLYTMLHQREVFLRLANHQPFQDILHNLVIVLEHFTYKLEELLEEKTPSPDTILETIRQAALHWPTDRLRRFPDLKFRYVEEEEPEEFFVPYIWSLVTQSTGLLGAK